MATNVAQNTATNSTMTTTFKNGTLVNQTTIPLEITIVAKPVTATINIILCTLAFIVMLQWFLSYYANYRRSKNKKTNIPKAI